MPLLLALALLWSATAKAASEPGGKHTQTAFPQFEQHQLPAPWWPIFGKTEIRLPATLGKTGS